MAIDWDVVHANWGSVQRVSTGIPIQAYFDSENRPTASQAVMSAKCTPRMKTASGNAGVDLWVRISPTSSYTKDKIDRLSGFGFIYNRVW